MKASEIIAIIGAVLLFIYVIILFLTRNDDSTNLRFFYIHSCMCIAGIMLLLFSIFMLQLEEIDDEFKIN